MPDVRRANSLRGIELCAEKVDQGGAAETYVL